MYRVIMSLRLYGGQFSTGVLHCWCLSSSNYGGSVVDTGVLIVMVRPSTLGVSKVTSVVNNWFSDIFSVKFWKS